MYRDPSEFRERFKAYKEGKSVREIYGLPGYAGGKFDAATKKKIDYYYKLLRNNGFDMMSAVGILGNMMQESSFDPNVVNHLGYHGLLLNSKAIQNAIKNLYGDLSEQSLLRYLSDWTDGATWIRKGPYALDTALYSKSYLRSGYKTPEQAAYEFLKRYERAIVVDPKTKKALRDANGNYVYLDKNKRLGYAKSIYNYLSGRPDGIQDLIALVGATQPEPIIAVPDATRVSTIPTIQLKAIDYSDRRNAVAAEALRAIWAHNVMEDMKGAYQVPIWESPSLPALTPVEYDVTPLKTYAGGKVAEEDEPVIRQGTKGSRLDRFSRIMDPDEDDGTVTRVVKKIGKGVADLVNDAKTVSGLRTIERFSTHTLNPSDYIDAAFLTVGNAMISKMLKASPKLYMKNFIQSFTDMDARALGKYFFLEHPELMTKPQEAWYGELAKKSDAYFRQAISHRAKLFDKAGKPLSPESIAAQISPDIKIAPIKGSRYGGIYSAPDNTMLINSDLVNDPRTAARVYNHERAHSMLTAFENEVGLPYPVNYGVEMEALFPFTAEQKAKRPGVHLGKEIDASLHEVKSLRSYDTDQLGRALDIDFLNMSDEEFRLYANNGYFKDVMLNIQNGLQAQKKFIGKLKNGKLPRYKDGTKIQWDVDAGIWRRVMDDPYADVFNNLVITPKYIRPKFEYETNPSYQQPNKNEVVRPDETLWTRQLVEKANNTRTWRSDAADAMKYVQYISDAAGLLYGMAPRIKQRAAKAIYRNIVPASYKDSYLPGGKKQEVVNAVKDFFTPKKLDLDNSAYRKWEQENLSGFFTDTNPVAARDEIYRKYLGLPNDDFYYIKNADGTYSHNLTNHEPHDIVTIINNTYNNDNGLSGKNQVLPDMLNSAGGWVNTSLKKVNDIQARFKYNDVWDVNPFQDADRVGNVFPKKLLNKYSHIEKLANGEDVRVWNKDVPWFIKKLQNFELSDLTNGAPVPVKTDINVRLLNPEEYSYTKKLTDAQIIDKMKRLDLSDAYDYYGDAISDGFISEADWNEIELHIADNVYDTFYKDPNKYRKMFVYNVNHPLKKLFDLYGPFVLLRGYKDGKISIKPSKRGTFTAAAKKHGASVREFESRVLKNPEKYSKAMVRKALFSRNARSWH